MVASQFVQSFKNNLANVDLHCFLNGDSFVYLIYNIYMFLITVFRGPALVFFLRATYNTDNIYRTSIA